jgi:hypothetical protein
MAEVLEKVERLEGLARAKRMNSHLSLLTYVRIQP